MKSTKSLSIGTTLAAAAFAFGFSAPALAGGGSCSYSATKSASNSACSTSAKSASMADASCSYGAEKTTMTAAKNDSVSIVQAGYGSKADKASYAKTVVDIVAGSENHKTLATLVTQAGLIDTLQGDGPFTVFAPTDAAFAKVPADTLKALGADMDALRGVLTYHVTPGLIGEEFATPSVKSVNGAALSIKPSIQIEGANVVATVRAGNGVVHVIDSVLIPPTETASAGTSNMTIAELAMGTPDLSTLVTAVKAAGLVDALNGDQKLTVFAPTNAAFEALPKGVLDQLLASPDSLKNVLLYHVVDGAVPASAVVKTKSVSTLQGDSVAVNTKGSEVMIGDAKVVMTDIQAKNGVIHVIDTVLVPG